MAILGGGQYFLANLFAPTDSGNGNIVAGADIPLAGPLTPELAVRAVYKSVATNDAVRICSSTLKGPGGVAFAKDFGAANCEQAITAEAAKVTDPATCPAAEYG